MRGDEERERERRLRSSSTAPGIRWQRTQGNLNDSSAPSLSLSLSAACRMRRALNYTWVQLKTRTIPQGVKGMNDTQSLFLLVKREAKDTHREVIKWPKRKRRKQYI